MPRKARGAKRKADCGLPESSVQKISAIADSTEQETLDDLIFDFNIQAENMVKQTKKLFMSECKKILQLLPQKSSIPKEILKMSAYEFKARGGSVEAVMESLRRGDVYTASHPTATSPPTINQGKENNSEAFVTPAPTARSRAVTADITTTKRKPKPMERVQLTAASDSGSPVDENTFVKLKMGQSVEDYDSYLLASISNFPQKWRSQLQQKMRHARLKIMTQAEDTLQTPALRR